MCLQELLQSWSIMTTRDISYHIQLWRPSASRTALDPSLQGNLWVHSIPVSQSIFKYTELWRAGTSSWSNG
jgi:hypothetical protein